MADNNYSTIQQHQPLRVPVSFDKQGKALVFQLDEIFDDIYRRFGRLRLEDMGKDFRKEFADAEGNITTLIADVSGLTSRVGDAEGDISTLTQRADQIDIVVADKYDKQSGIDIKAEGIELSGSEYLKIKSGCSLSIETGGTIDVNATNFKIDSENKKIVIGDRSSGEWTISAIGIELDVQDSNNPYTHYDSRIMPIANAQGFTFYMETVGLGDSVYYSLNTGGFSGSINTIPAQHPDLGSSADPWGTVYYDTLSQVSTRKAKHDIESLPDMGEKLDALRPVSYKYNNDPDEKTRFGLIYEDTLPVMPEICGEEAINYVELVPVLLKEVQSLRKEVQILRERVSALEG